MASLNARPAGAERAPTSRLTTGAAFSGRAPFISVGTKLAFAMLSVLALVTAFTYIGVNRNEREQLLASKERAATMVTELFAAGVTAPLSFGDEPGVRESIALLMKNANVLSAAVWGLDPTNPGRGVKLAESARDGQSPKWDASLASKAHIERLDSALVVEQPVVGPSGEVLGAVRVAFSLQRENATIAAAQQRTLFTSLALALGLGAVQLALTRSLIVRRLERLAKAAKRLEDGKAASIDVKTNDEVGNLARAFASMTEAIASREAHISARNRDLRRVLDNVTEGLFTVSKEGHMSDERSRVLDEWFGPPANAHQFFEYFESFAPVTARWLRLGFTALQDDFVPVEVVLDEMPKRFDHGARSFELEYLPIWVGAEVDQNLGELLVVVRDITSRIERERSEQAQRVAMNVFRRMLNDRAGFREFSREALRLVDAIAEGSIELRDPSRTLRDVHTLKGNSALYGIETVAEICHRIESRIHDESGGPDPRELGELRAAWSTIRVLAEELDRSASDDLIELHVDEYTEHLRLLETRFPNDALTVTARNWANELASHRLTQIAEQGRSLAQRLGKPDVVVDVSVVPATLRLPTDTWTPLWSAFSHVLRNTFDHGIETATERAGAGKQKGGHVMINLASTRTGVELSVVDDGRGIAWESIRKRAADLGLPHETQADLEEALYADRVSSRTDATETSGRGVGMGAVRDVVRACGGSITIETQAGRGTTLRLRMPRSMVDAPRRSMPPSRAA